MDAVAQHKDNAPGYKRPPNLDKFLQDRILLKVTSLCMYDMSVTFIHERVLLIPLEAIASFSFSWPLSKEVREYSQTGM